MQCSAATPISWWFLKWRKSIYKIDENWGYPQPSGNLEIFGVWDSFPYPIILGSGIMHVVNVTPMLLLDEWCNHSRTWNELTYVRMILPLLIHHDFQCSVAVKSFLLTILQANIALEAMAQSKVREFFHANLVAEPTRGLPRKSRAQGCPADQEAPSRSCWHAAVVACPARPLET